MAKKQEPEREYNSILDGNAQSEPLLSSPMPEKRAAKKLPWKPILIVTAVVAVLLGVLIGGGIYFEHLYEEEYKKQEQELYNKSYKVGASYFVNPQTEPEKSNTQITLVVTEVFYTNDGHLAVNICFGNGMSEDKTVTAVDITITNGNTQEVIAKGRSELSATQKNVTVPANGTANLLVYISPEYVKITNDPLSDIGYSVKPEL